MLSVTSPVFLALTLIVSMSSITSPVGSFLGPVGLPGASGNANPLGTIQGATIGGQNVNLLTAAAPSLSPGGSFLGGQNAATTAAANDGLSSATNDINGLFGTNLTSPTASSSGGISGAISDLFLRSVVIILGFIFVAVGLSMFKNNGGKL